jgi:hypothetical protein
MSQSVRAAVQSGDLSPEKGAQLANELRNQIMDMQRRRDFDLGRSLAASKKAQGLAFESAIQRALPKTVPEGKPFAALTGEQQRQVLLEVIDVSGRSRSAVTAGIPRVRWAARGLWLATLLVAGYSIGTAENPWWQTGREGANIGGGLAGGADGGREQCGGSPAVAALHQLLERRGRVRACPGTRSRAQREPLHRAGCISKPG